MIRHHSVSREEYHSPHHHHHHHEEHHHGPHGSSYEHEEEEHEEHPYYPPMDVAQLKIKTVDPHDKENQLLVSFPLKLIATPSQLNTPEQQSKLKVDIWKAILAAAKDQALLTYDPCKGCPVPMDIKCMKGFVYKICIWGFENTFPYDLGIKFPGTECSYERNADGTPAGTFVIDGRTNYCCERLCKYEANHRENIKKQLGKYGGYHDPEELWIGSHPYGRFWHVPSNCMGAAIVMENRFDPETGRGFKISTKIVMKDSYGIGYYKWPDYVIKKINDNYRQQVMPRLQGKLLDFRCAEEYVIEIVRADAKLDGEDERDFSSRKGTVYEEADDSTSGDIVFNGTQIMRAHVELYLGFTNKASIEQICC